MVKFRAKIRVRVMVRVGVRVRIRVYRPTMMSSVFDALGRRAE